MLSRHKGGAGQETGYSLEVFNAIGETITVLVVEESMILPVQADEILQFGGLRMSVSGERDVHKKLRN